MNGERPEEAAHPSSDGAPSLGSAALRVGRPGGDLAACTPDAEPEPRGPGGAEAFGGIHQPGIDTPAARFGLLAAFNLVNEDKARLASSLRDLTDEARGLMEGTPAGAARHRLPTPTETGILGPRGPTGWP